ncbi:lipocalin family protein [uncultured Polaribacter sp.]|uniref:lipocalin family protein n=1 Tax=uncultured Polaribacter sp. TaxID=174711 RepID=UPI0026237B36|nr:lipocalin family protein [uncultured Polaribacter sp.]
MKRINFAYLTLFTILLISSCSNSDDTNEISTSSIIAKWEEQPVNTNCSQTETIEFFANGTVQSLDLINPPCDYQLGTAEYTFEADILEVNIEDNSFSDGIYTIRYNVITLNETTLIVEPFYDDEVGTYTGTLERFTYQKI